MSAEELYKIYAKWTGELHFYVLKHLKRHVDVEFFPDPYWYFKIYSGHIQTVIGTVGFGRPAGERSETIPVPAPEDSPSQEKLDLAFRLLCLAAARVLGVDIGKVALPASNAPESKSMLKHASLADAPKRDHTKNRKSDGSKRSGTLRLRKPRRTSKVRGRSASARKTG